MASTMDLAREPAVWAVFVVAMALGALVARLFSLHAARKLLERQRSRCAGCEARLAREAAERERVALRLVEQENKFSTVIRSAPVGVMLQRADGTLVEINPAGREMLELEMVQDATLPSLYRFLRPEYHACYAALTERVFRGEEDSLQFEITGARGCPRWLETHAVPMLDGHGRVMALLGITRDITERRQTEEKLRQRQIELAHVCRLSTLGEMASGLAHELNQPLCAISTYADAALRRMKAGGSTPGAALQTLERIAAQAERAGAIIRRLRDLVAKRPPRRQTVSINDLIVEVTELLQAELSAHSVSVRRRLAQVPSPVIADPVQIQQVVLNLARNAIDAMSEFPAPRELVIQTCRIEGNRVEVTIQDNGPGLPDGPTEEVFAPFFTTKRNGIGMGLPISRSIIEAHGGRIQAKNNADGGACFSFTLPACTLPLQPDEALAAAEEAPAFAPAVSPAPENVSAPACPR